MKLALPERDMGIYRIRLDNTEVSAYRHNDRCYFYEHVLGLIPPESSDESEESRATLDFGSALHTFLEKYYSSGDETYERSYAIRHMSIIWDDILNAHADKGNFRSLGRAVIAAEAYLEDTDRQERDAYWEVLETEHYWEKPIGGTIGYGGKLDLMVRDDRDNSIWVIDHKTTKKNVEGSYYYGWHMINPQMTGYWWLGEYATGMLKEQGKIDEDATFGGIIINAIQVSPRIDYRAKSIPISRTEHQVQDWLRNVYLIGTRIIRQRQETEELLAKGHPITNAWPHYNSYAEGWCHWSEINNAPDEEIRDNLLATCTFSPWWERRLTEDI